MSPSLATTYAVHPPTSEPESTIVTANPRPTRPFGLQLLSEGNAQSPTDTCAESAIVDDDEETASDTAEPITPPNGPSLAPLDKNDQTPTPPKAQTDPVAVPKQLEHSRTKSKRRSSPMRIKTKLKSVFGSKKHSRDGTSPVEIESPGGSIFSRRRPTFRISSPTSSCDQSPPSPRSPSNTGIIGTSVPTESRFLHPNRASTGPNFRERGNKIGWLVPQTPESRMRSPSLSDTSKMQERYAISRHAETGVGLKARRLSSSLPDDFIVDTCELSEEFVSTSVIPGRRGKQVGEGATATVSVMYRRGNKDIRYAVKEFRKMAKNESPAEYEEKVKSEFTIAKSLQHPNIVKTYRLCTRNGRWNHVMEFCAQGELFSLIQRNYLSDSDKLCLFKQVVRGVAYLHENGIAHRDIKLENLLLTDEGHVKITDFGVSEVFSGIHPGLRSAGGKCGQDMDAVRLCSPGICGSLPYIAPEVLAKKGPYDPRPLDVWSCGIVYLTMMCNGYLWSAADTENPTYKSFIRGWERFLERNPEGITSDAIPRCGAGFGLLTNLPMKRLVLRMLHPDPAKRITIQEVIKDRYFKNIECCAPDHLEDASDVGQIDVSGRGSLAAARSMRVLKSHNHIPPPAERKIASAFTHRFDMGDGYS